MLETSEILSPAQTIISVPVHTAVSSDRAAAAPVVLVAVNLSVVELYLPPLLTKLLPLKPPQTIISEPVDTAV